MKTPKFSNTYWPVLGAITGGVVGLLTTNVGKHWWWWIFEGLLILLVLYLCHWHEHQRQLLRKAYDDFLEKRKR